MSHAAVAARVATRLDAIVEDMLERVWSNPALERWTRPETRGIAEQIARDSIARELEALRSGELPVVCPEEDLAAARAAVTYGAPVTVVLQCYRAGHAAIWRAWVDAVDRVDPENRRELLEAGAEFLFDYVDRCSAWVEDEYTRERERLLRSEEQQRVHVIRDILEGADPDPDALGYELGGDHLGLIAWGGDADAALRDAHERLGGELLAVGVDARTSWGWLRDASDARAIEDLRLRAGTALAAGSSGAGIEGFRRTHHEARQARRVAALRPAPVTRYEDVALEALASEDEERARGFVAAELGELAAGGRREELLRETLRAYFSAGQNAASAAATLGVHERTVANRLAAVESRIGRPVALRRAELETALRLHGLLGL